MTSRSKRARVAGAAIAVAVAAPLAVAGTANAAIAGAAGSQTTNRPDLVSAASTGTTTMQVCYDKPLVVQTVTPSDFTINRYLSGTTIGEVTATTASVNTSSPDCVNVGFNAPVDLTQGTILTGLAGAVDTSSAANLTDSVTVSTASSSTGTAGHTAGPALTSAKSISSTTAPNATTQNNAITYTFDKNVDPSSLVAGDFYFDTATAGAAGAAGTATAVQGSAIVTETANTVTVEFNTGSQPTSNAVTAFITPGAAHSAGNGTAADEVANLASDYAIGGVTVDPAVASASLTGSNGTFNSILFQLDQPLSTAQAAAANAAPGDFYAGLADGQEIPAASVVATAGSNTVTATYATTGANALNPVAEYATQAVINTGTGANPLAAGLTPSDAAIGGNAGLNARGYTTGPDVQAVVPEGTNGATGGPQYLVYLDQRVAPVGAATGAPVPGDIALLDGNGNNVATASSVEVQNLSGPGQQEVLVVFPSGGFFSTSGAQLDFTAGAFTTNLPTSVAGDPNGSNVTQIVTATNSAAHVKGLKITKHGKHAVKKHVVRKHVARKHS